MMISAIDISDYVSGRLDVLDQWRMERALATCDKLRKDVAKAQALHCAVKIKLSRTHGLIPIAAFPYG